MRRRIVNRCCRLLLAASALVLAGCSSCDARARPDGSVVASAADSGKFAAPAAPTVKLAPQVASRSVGAWPEQTRALSPAQVARLLPSTEGARIQLDDAGLEPRSVRRHALAEGTTRRLLLELDLGMTVVQDGETSIPPVPALRVEVGLTTLDVMQGVARVQLKILKAAVRPRGDADADAVAQVGPLVEKLPGIQAILRITAQGLRGRSPAPPKSTPQELWQLWSTIAEAVSDAIVPFPAEPIGAGAKWVVLDRQRRAGVVMLRRTQMTLLDISAGDLRVSGQLVEAAIAGSAGDPALPKEIVLEVLEGVTVGKRRHTVRGTDLWPLASTTELSSDLRLRATATAGHFSDTKTSKVKLTQVLRCVRGDASAATHANPAASASSDVVSSADRPSP